MSKTYSAREVASTVLKKAEEMIRKAQAQSKDMLSSDKGLEPKAQDAKGQDRIEDSVAPQSKEERREYKVSDASDKETGKASGDNTKVIKKEGEEDKPDHWSSPSGCHQDCPACAMETAGKSNKAQRPLKKFMSAVISKKASRK